MDWLCPFLGGLAFVLLIVTLVGHGLWVLVARIFGSSRSGSEPQHRPPLGSLPGTTGSLAITRREIERLRRLEQIDSATAHKVLKAIDSEIEAPVKPPQPAPPVAPPVRPLEPVRPAAPPTSAPITDRPTPPVPVLPAAPPVAPPIPKPPVPAFTGEPPPAPEPRRALSDVLTAFMEEKNIRWGELIGGMLIVLCSTALVVSLWSQIAAVPFVKFFVFTAVTAAMFGVGLYTEHRWKLPTTSRGILITATLLVPLTFLAIAAFSKSADTRDWLAIPAEVVALVAFAGLLYGSTKVIAPFWPLTIAISVLGSSAAHLLIRRFVTPDSPPANLLWLGAIPIVFYGGAIARMLRASRHWTELDKSRGNAVFLILGLTSFAAITTLGLLLFKSGHAARTLRQLSMLVALFGVPLVATGLLFWQKMTHSDLAAARTAGTSIGVAGVIIMIIGLALAWPQPARLLPIALLDFALLVVIALRYGIPAAHLPGLACLLIAYLLGVHLLFDRLPWQTSDAGEVLRALFSAASGTSLVVLVALLGAAFALLARLGKHRHAVMYAAGAAVSAALSLALVTAYGLGRADDHGTAWVYGIYALGALVGAGYTKRAAAAAIASLLMLLAIVQGVVYRYGPIHGITDARQAWQIALLAHASIGALILAVTHRLQTRGGADFGAIYAHVFQGSSLITSTAALLPLVLGLSIATSGPASLRLLWLAAIWVILARESRSIALFSAFQLAVAAAAALAVVARLSTRVWFDESPHPLLDPRTLQTIGTTLTILSLIWIILRLLVRHFAAGSTATEMSRFVRAQRLLNPPWTSIDRLILFAMLLGLVAVSLYGLLPAMAVEFARSNTAADRALSGTWMLAPLAFGPGAWFFLLALVATFVVALWERFEQDLVFALVLLAGWICVLIAGREMDDRAAASALRWCLGGYWILASAIVWLREPIRRLVTPLRWPAFDQRPAHMDHAVRVLLILLTVLPILTITTLRVGLALAGVPALGPVEECWFFRMGDTLAYAVPLALVSLGLIGHALREQSPRYAFAAGLIVNFTVTLAWLMAAATTGRVIGGPELIELAQINIITAALYALLWLIERQWIARMPVQPVPYLLTAQVWIGLAGNMLLILPAAAWLILRPRHHGPGIIAAGGLLGWIALFLAVTAAAWYVFSSARKLQINSICAVLLGIVSLIAFDVCRVDAGQWRGYHALLVGSTIVAWMAFALFLPQPHDWLAKARLGGRLTLTTGSITRCIHAAGVLTLLLALRGVLSDPARPWWSVGAIVALSVLAVALARLTRNERYLYASGALFNLAATIWWLTDWWRPQPGHGRWVPDFIELVEVNVIALFISGLCSLALTLRGIQWKRRVTALPAFHAAAATLAVVSMLAVVAVGLAADAQARPLHPSATVGWLAWAAAAGLAVACLWDLALPSIGQLVYLAGLAAVAMAIDAADLRPRWLLWTAAVSVPVWSLLISILYFLKEPILAWAAQHRLPDRRGLSALPTPAGHMSAAATAEPARAGTQDASVAWLIPAVMTMTVLSFVLSLSVIFSFSASFLNQTQSAALALRLIVALALVIQVLAVGLLAHALRHGSLGQQTLLLGALATVAIGWTFIEPRGPQDGVLGRTVVLMVAVAATTSLCGFLLSKLRRRETAWTQAGDATIPWLVATGIGALIVILGAEIFYQVDRGHVPMGYPSILAVLLALFALVPITLSFAMIPGRDPLGLPERQRTLYVYTAEVLLALAFMHIRLTMPWLFTGFFERYWPLVVMFIAFIGVGLSELFHRQNRLVLAEPLERTGALLPMLPVLAFWSVAGRTNVHYSLQLVVVGALYTVLAVRRRSFAYGVLAALAGNGGLWYFLHYVEGYGLLEHPQLWFIPAAASMLVAAHLNRDRLQPAQLATIRYLSIALIYLSSTTEIFLNGVREAPWLPLVLAALSVAGVLAGIVLRVRSFLFLGSLFLLVSLLTMIWHASANLGWTWLWYVAGIALGLAIITVFAVFEKKRAQIVSLLDGLKTWHA